MKRQALTRRVIKIAQLALLPMAISACSGFKSVENPQRLAHLPETPAAFNLAGAATAQELIAHWWAQLKDEQLTHLVNDSLQHNHTVRIALASLEESRAYLRHATMDRYPTVEASATGVRQKQNLAPQTVEGERITETYQAGFDASWELDIFGRVRNGVRLSEAQAAARLADLQAVRVSVAAEVASAYINLRGNQYLLSVAERNAKNQQESLDLTRRFDEVGRGDKLDVARAEAQLELTRARIPELHAQINAAINRIAVLTGTPSVELKTSLALAKPLPQVPASFAVGNPADLLKRRPDIRRTEHALAGAIAEYNIRVADLYPTISFTGGLGYYATDWSQLGNKETETFFFSPRIHWAAFNLARVNAQITAADARTRQRVAEFEQNVLTALEEADTALQNFSREEERRTGLQRALAASNQAAMFARKRFEVGSSDFLTVLDAERSLLDVSAQLAQSDMQVLLRLIAVYKTLGGGWELQQGEIVSQVNH